MSTTERTTCLAEPHVVGQQEPRRAREVTRLQPAKTRCLVGHRDSDERPGETRCELAALTTLLCQEGQHLLVVLGDSGSFGLPRPHSFVCDITGYRRHPRGKTLNCLHQIIRKR